MLGFSALSQAPLSTQGELNVVVELSSVFNSDGYNGDGYEQTTAAYAQVGSLTPEVSYSISGVSSTSETGTLGTLLSYDLSSVSSDLNLGTISTQQEVSLEITGIISTAYIADSTASQSISKNVGNVVSNSSVSTFGPLIDVYKEPASLTITTELGTIETSIVYERALGVQYSSEGYGGEGYQNLTAAYSQLGSVATLQDSATGITGVQSVSAVSVVYSETLQSSTGVETTSYSGIVDFNQSVPKSPTSAVLTSAVNTFTTSQNSETQLSGVQTTIITGVETPASNVTLGITGVTSTSTLNTVSSLKLLSGVQTTGIVGNEGVQISVGLSSVTTTGYLQSIGPGVQFVNIFGNTAAARLAQSSTGEIVLPDRPTVFLVNAVGPNFGVIKILGNQIELVYEE